MKKAPVQQLLIGLALVRGGNRFDGEFISTINDYEEDMIFPSTTAIAGHHSTQLDRVRGYWRIKRLAAQR